MPQFDLLIIVPVLSSLLFVLFLYYHMSLKVLIPDFFGTKKFREKKLSLTKFFCKINNYNELKVSSIYFI